MSHLSLQYPLEQLVLVMEWLRSLPCTDDITCTQKISNNDEVVLPDCVHGHSLESQLPLSKIHITS